MALLEQAQGPLEALRKRMLTERDSSSKAANVTLMRIESRIAQVAEALTVQLTSPAISVTEARVVVGLLKRMHLESKAKEVFLSGNVSFVSFFSTHCFFAKGRTQHIVTGIKQLKPDANRVAFVRSLARLVFFTLRDTCADYLQCFGDSSNSLCTLSVWCMKETHSFGLLWVRFVVDRAVAGGATADLLSSCLSEALSCVRLLEAYGFFFDKMLRDQLLAAVVQKHETFARETVQRRVLERLQKEDWYATPQIHRGLFEV